ncbi:MAG: pyridoxal-phosphate dependent enzyme, partial [Firmicutes bacterium]|nr:pyridoxal-phosphate dependent enzyme [Bacillota bacterium]
GIAFPFVHDKLVNGAKIRLVGVEPSACPTLTRGKFAYDYGDTAGLTPMVHMYTLGAEFMPPGIHSGGLRYHGDSPLLSQLVHDGIIEATAINQTAIFEAAKLFARSEGIIPAPESAHAIQHAIKEALDAREAGESRTILFNLSGHGLLDMPSYEAYLAGKLEDYPLPEDLLAQSLQKLPGV